MGNAQNCKDFDILMLRGMMKKRLKNHFAKDQ